MLVVRDDSSILKPCTHSVNTTYFREYLGMDLQGGIIRHFVESDLNHNSICRLSICRVLYTVKIHFYVQSHLICPLEKCFHHVFSYTTTEFHSSLEIFWLYRKYFMYVMRVHIVSTFDTTSYDIKNF